MKLFHIQSKSYLKIYTISGCRFNLVAMFPKILFGTINELISLNQLVQKLNKHQSQSQCNYHLRIITFTIVPHLNYTSKKKKRVEEVSTHMGIRQTCKTKVKI